MTRIKTALAVTALVAAFYVPSLLACASSPASTPAFVRAKWRPLDPPRAGLRCWYTYDVGYGASFCEPDPSATHGASP